MDLPAYPAHREADVGLRDGSTIHVRPVRPDDRAAIRAFLASLSTRSKAFRFFSAAVNVERMADRAVDVDHHDRYGLVAVSGADGRVVGHAMYVRLDATRAESAFAVADDLQGHGLGTILLAHLAEAGHDAGVQVFVNEVLPENHRMIEVFRESGFPVQTQAKPGYIQIEVPTSLTREGLERFELREQTSAAAAMAAFLKPRSVAVVGASRSRGTIGGELFHNILAAGFTGSVYPVNPNAEAVQGVRAYPSVGDVPGPVDLAVIVVPAPLVTDVATACGHKGVRALLVISNGFAETGPAGATRQHDLLAVCRGYGMRLIGPNCMGVIDTDPGVALDATFASSFPPRGRIGFLSQSGALGIAVIEGAGQAGLGISSFVSVGNKADISGNDVLRYWDTDPETGVILLYLESFGNPRNFARISRKVGRSKAIVVVKSGRSTAGARATTSHTGALLGASDVTVDALFRQSGVIRTDTLAEMFDVASVLDAQPAPRGGRVGIVTNAGGPGILCADACEALGLEVPSLSEETWRELEAFLPPEAALGNPVDMIASATAEDYARAIRIVAGDGGIDAVVAIFIPPLVTRAPDVARAVRTAAADLAGSVPLLAVFMAGERVREDLVGAGVRVPTFAFPEEAVRALAHVARYGAWLARPEGTEPALEGIRQDEASGLIAAALARGPGWLRPEEVAGLLDCYGMPIAPWRSAGTPSAVAAAAAQLGGPVALKAIASGLVHKTEAGGVQLGLAGPEDAAAAAARMRRKVRAAGHRVEGFLVQRMVAGGTEMLVGVVHDPTFGPVVAVAAGGTAVELLHDVAVRITPLTDVDAREMVRSLATFPLLDGYRGMPKLDVTALEDLLLRTSALVEAHPEIAEMDCNPVKLLPQGAVIVDARVRVEQPTPRPPLLARRN